MSKYDVFISYSRKDITLAERIEKELLAAGMKCFRDKSKIRTTEDWVSMLTESILDSHLFLLLGSCNAYTAKWTKRELLFADKNNLLIYPYLIDNSPIPDVFSFILSTTDPKSMSGFPIKKMVKELAGIVHEKSSIEPEIVFPLSPLSCEAKGVPFKMMPIHAGTFTMGSRVRGSGYPAHEVRLLKNYYLGQTAVTQELWEAVMGSNPSSFLGPNLPVENVSWDECKLFLRKLKRLTGHHFRLPTEAEWEFAAREGKPGNGYMYSGGSSIGELGWYRENSSGTKAVKLKKGNALHLYDMSGNVNEWCQDFYSVYPDRRMVDPQGPREGVAHVYRGGSWYEGELKCRVYVRGHASPEAKSSNLGIRLALSYDS